MGNTLLTGKKGNEGVIDLVILDLDGTILNEKSDTGFSPAVREAVAQVQAAGIPVTIATGRTLDYVRQRAPLLNITQPVVTTQGAVIGDPQNGHILAESPLPLESARRVARWADCSQRVVVFYFNDENGHSRIYQNREIWDPAIYDHWFGTPRHLQPKFAQMLAAADAHPPIKFIVVNDPSHEADLTPVLQEHFGANLHISRTHSSLVEGTAAGVDKGQGVLRLLQLLDIAPGRTLAIGDNENDIPMLEVVGLGVAMGQAVQKVRAVADWVAPTIDEDGVAVALQKFVLDKIRPG